MSDVDLLIDLITKVSLKRPSLTEAYGTFYPSRTLS